MGIEKPYELEHDSTMHAPGPPRPKRTDAHIKQMFAPSGHGVRVAGHTLDVDGDRDMMLERLRRTARKHMLKRRPNADERTWARLQERVSAIATRYSTADQDLQRAVEHTIDGL